MQPESTGPAADVRPADRPLSPEQREFATLLGRLLADLWRETQAAAQAARPRDPHS